MALSGCGYALAGRGSFLPADIQTVGIPELENRSTFFQVEDTITEKIRTEFIGRGKYAVTPEAPDADGFGPVAAPESDVVAIVVVAAGKPPDGG